jgi:hypothetical protein
VIDNAQALGSAESGKAFFQGLGVVLSGRDSNHDGRAGYAQFSGSVPEYTSFGEELGPVGRGLWVSSAGSAAEWLLNGVTMACGLGLYHRHARLGAALLGGALASHISASMYPLSAAGMTPGSEAWNKALSEGHDWVRVAEGMHTWLGCSPHTAAVGIGVGYLLSLPALCVGWYGYQKGRYENTVPDNMAFRMWMLEHSSHPEGLKRIEKLFQKYPRQQAWLAAQQKIFQKIYQPSVSGEDFEEALTSWKHACQDMESYFFTCVSRAEWSRVKTRVLQSWSSVAAPSATEVWLSRLSVGSVSVSTLLPVLRILGHFYPACHQVAQGLTYASPVLSVGISAHNAWTAYREMRAPEQVIPKPSKVASVCKFIVAVWGLTLIHFSLFGVLGKTVLLPVIVLTFLVQVGLSLYRNHTTRKRLEAEVYARFAQEEEVVQRNIWDALRRAAREKPRSQVRHAEATATLAGPEWV